MTKRLLKHIGVGALLAPVIVIRIWCPWVVNTFQLQKPYGHNLVRACAMAFTAPNLLNFAFGKRSVRNQAASVLVGRSIRYGTHRLPIALSFAEISLSKEFSGTRSNLIGQY